LGTATYRLRLYQPHDAQLRYHQSGARYRVCAWGRQAGKSTGSLNDIVKKAWEIPGSTNWFISPTHDQAKVQYRRLVGMLWPVSEIMLKKNQSELRVKLINQSQIVFKGGQNFEALRGETLNGCVIDEVREQDRNLWPMVIRPMLATTKGWASFISTPNGFDSFYDLASQAMGDSSGEWFFMNAPSNANPLISLKEIENMKKNMNEKQFRQEVMAEFVDLTSGKAYYSFSSENLRTQNPFAPIGSKLSKHLPIAVGMDFNVNPMCWTLGQHKIKSFHWFDEIALEQSNTLEAAEVLAQKVKGHDPGIVIVGDASGKSRSTASAGKTDYDIIATVLRRHGIRFENRTPESNPLVRDRVNMVNLTLRSATGDVNMTIDPVGCPRLVKDFERVTIRESTAGIFALEKSRDPSITHSSDGVGYYIYKMVGEQLDDRPIDLRVLIR
jgi:hypothetical protein